MNVIQSYLQEVATVSWRNWNRFWFTPADPATLGFVRICVGLMLLYTHAVWSLDLQTFFGRDGWISEAAIGAYRQGPSAPPAPLAGQVNANGQEEIRPRNDQPVPQPLNLWKPSHFYYITSPAAMWTVHILALGVFAALVVGWQTRVMSILAYLLTISYAHRIHGALFGLDQINSFLALYVMLGPSGAAYSLDRWLKQRSAPAAPGKTPSVSANIAIRLIQLHMCLVYLIAGMAKLSGESWWDGSAMWMTFANYGYQTLDMTWLNFSPALLALFTHITVAWELSFCVLIWNRLWRPIMLVGAVILHMGIGVALGMMAFGLVMLIGCSSFLPPEFVRALFDRRVLQPIPVIESRNIPASKRQRKVRA